MFNERIFLIVIARIKVFAIVVCLALGSTSSFAANSSRPRPAKDCALASPIQGSDSIGASAKPSFPPVQLDISVPFEPTLFPSGDFSYLVYELHFQSYTDEPLKLQELEIVDISRTPSRAVASFTGSQLYETLLPIGVDKIDGDHPLEGGRRAVALICLALDDAGTVPEKLGHPRPGR
jgi:hypothetical protein